MQKLYINLGVVPAWKGRVFLVGAQCRLQACASEKAVVGAQCHSHAQCRNRRRGQVKRLWSVNM